MKYRVISAAFDLTKNPPARVKFTGDNALTEYMGVEIIDAEENVLFRHCENAHDVEDTVLAFWNRLNESSLSPPYYTHNGAAKVVVVDCRPVEGSE